MARLGFTFSDGNVAANVLEDRVWWAGFQNGEQQAGRDVADLER